MERGGGEKRGGGRVEEGGRERGGESEEKGEGEGEEEEGRGGERPWRCWPLTDMTELTRVLNI